MSEPTMIGDRQYVTAFFDNEADAAAAVARIEAEGVSRSEIRIIAGERPTDEVPAVPRERGFFEALSDMFMPDEDRYAYAEGLNRGGYLVSLNTTASNRDRILDILDDEGTVDMDAREESWRSEGWQGYHTDEAGMTTAPAGMPSAPHRSAPAEGGVDEATIEVVEEHLRVGKRDVNAGRVRVRSYVVESPVEEDVSLRSEVVHLDRKPVDRPATAADAAFVDRTIEAVETSEEAVVSKEARVVEEISLGKTVDTRTEIVRDTVRHTEVEVDDERVKTLRDKEIDRIG